MRPIHALILVVLLALGLAGLWLVLGGGDRAGRIAPALSGAPPAVETPPAAPADLSTPEDASVVRSVEEAATRAEPGKARATSGSPASAFTLRGRLVDARGRPVAGGTVWADAGGPDELPIDLEGSELATWIDRAEAKTATDGTFTLSPKARAEVRFAARVGGFAPEDRKVSVAGKSHDLGDVMLEDSAILEGRVLDRAGRGVADAEVYRVRDGGGGLMILGGRGSGVKVATTDAQGRFRVDQLRAGPWKLRIETAEHPDKIESGETERPGAVVANLEIILGDGAEIRGRVVGAPAELLPKLVVRAYVRPGGEDGGAEFLASGDLFGAAREGKCAADGSFHVRGLEPGKSYRVAARDAGQDFLGKNRTAPVQATAGDTSVQLHYKAETAIVCQVIDGVSGEPVEELEIAGGYGFQVPLMDGEGRPQRKFPGGRVRYAGFPGRSRAGELAELAIEATGYRPWKRADIAVVDGQDLDLGVVRLERAPLVKVEVTDARTGAPVAGARVSLAEYTPPSSNDEVRMERRVSMRLGGDAHADGGLELFDGASARTDAQGRARVTSQPGETAVVRVVREGYAPWSSEPIALPAEGDQDVAVKLGPGGTVVVEVVDAHEKPVAGAELERKGTGQELEFLSLTGAGETRTDAQGLAMFEHLAPGTHRFRVGGGGGNGVFFGNGAVMKMRSAVTGASEGDGWSEVTVVEGETARLRLVAPERTTLVGRVQESGRDLAGARVELVEEGGDVMAELALFGGGPGDQTDSQGRYEIAGVEVKRYRVRVTHGARAMPWEGELELRSGENTFDIELPVAILEGQVTGPDGKPLAGVRVEAERAPDDSGTAPRTERRMVAFVATSDGGEPELAIGGPGVQRPTVLTDAEGKYRLRGVLADVDLIVKAKSKDAQPGRSGRVRVGQDEVKSHVDIRLETGGAIDVTLVRSNGQAASSCMVLATFEGTGEVEPRSEFSGSKGTVKLTGLKPGRWRIHVDSFATLPGAGERPNIPDQTVEVTAGQTGSARFEIP